MTLRETITRHIIERLEQDNAAIKAEFESDGGLGTRYAAIDGLLPPEIAESVYEAFLDGEGMRLLDSSREKKFTSKSLNESDPLIKAATFAFQDKRVIELISSITSLKDVVADPDLYTGGISAMTMGHFLNPHIDNSHDHEQKNYRVLNLSYYVTPNWESGFSGSLELWDNEVTESIEIPSLFNRLVLMSTNAHSIHSVSTVNADRYRCCVSNYYFSPHSPKGHEVSHVTSFYVRPEQPVMRALSKADSQLRSIFRKVKKSGFGKKDIFEENNGEVIISGE